MIATIDLFVLKRYIQHIAKNYWRSKIYRPLNLHKKEIRVLKLLPSDTLEGDPICTIETLSVNDDPKFAALSYVWGDQSNPRYMTVNGYRIGVGTNLHTALRYIRRSNGILPIWADALCINQEDVGERSRQVRIMDDIYSSAQLVCTWAGEATEVTETCFERLLGFALLYRLPLDDGSGAESLCRHPEMMLLVDHMLRYCHHITKASFWNRVWIVQEVIIGIKCNSGYLSMGPHVMSTTIFLHIIPSIEELLLRLLLSEIDIPYSTIRGQRLGDLGHAGSFLRLLQPFLRKEVQANNNYKVQVAEADTVQTLDLRSVLSVNQNLEVANPRDRVYGFLVLLPAVGVEANYENSVGKAYRDAVFKLTRHYGILDMLQFVDPDHEIDQDIPMWASGFRRAHHHTGRGAQASRRRWQTVVQYYNASHNAPTFLDLRGDMLLTLGFVLSGYGGVRLLGPMYEATTGQVPTPPE